MIQLGLTCLLAVHLVTVNVASAGPFVCIWLARRGRSGDQTADAVGRQLARWSLDALSLGVLLGVALIGILWASNQQAFLSALGRIEPRRLAFGGLELLFYYVLIAWYVVSWGRWRQFPWMHPSIAIVAGTNLVYHFPTLFTVVALMEERGAAAGAPQRFVTWLGDPELLARVAHFCLASLAVTGGALLFAAYRMDRSEHDIGRNEEFERVAGWGAQCILWPTLLQLPLGLYVLLALSEPARDRLLGGDLWGTAIFAAALLATLGLLHQLGTGLLGRIRSADCVKYIALLSLVVLLMVGARERARQPLVDRPREPSMSTPLNANLTAN